jgi:hypothetical protein
LSRPCVLSPLEVSVVDDGPEKEGGAPRTADAKCFALLATALNIARLGVPGILSTGSGNRAITLADRSVEAQ